MNAYLSEDTLTQSPMLFSNVLLNFKRISHMEFTERKKKESSQFSLARGALVSLLYDI